MWQAAIAKDQSSRRLVRSQSSCRLTIKVRISDVNLPLLGLRKRNHGVLSHSCRRTIEEASVVANYKSADNQTCCNQVLSLRETYFKLFKHTVAISNTQLQRMCQKYFDSMVILFLFRTLLLGNTENKINVTFTSSVACIFCHMHFTEGPLSSFSRVILKIAMSKWVRTTSIGSKVTVTIQLILKKKQ